MSLKKKWRLILKCGSQVQTFTLTWRLKHPAGYSETQLVCPRHLKQFPSWAKTLELFLTLLSCTPCVNSIRESHWQYMSNKSTFNHHWLLCGFEPTSSFCLNCYNRYLVGLSTSTLAHVQSHSEEEVMKGDMEIQSGTGQRHLVGRWVSANGLGDMLGLDDQLCELSCTFQSLPVCPRSRWTLGRWGGQLGEGMRERNKVLLALQLLGAYSKPNI